MIKVIIIDDHQLVRAGIREILQQSNNISVVGDAATGQEGLKCAQRQKPHVVLLDLKLPDMDGLIVTQKLLRHDPDIKILVVSGITHDFWVFRLLEAGARGYVLKTISAQELLNAIHAVYHGQRYISPQIASRLALNKIDHQSQHAFAHITDREMKVLKYIIQGISVRNIAEKMQISIKTVHSYRGRIFEKLNVDSDLAVMLLAIQHGLMSLTSPESV